MNCHVCGVSISPVINFGQMPIANNFQSNLSLDEYKFELATGFCEPCALFQIIEQPSPNKMFHSSYPFFTRLSTSMVEHFRYFAEDQIHNLRLLSPNPFVVELGSNDGTFLINFAKANIQHIGIDPSKNVVDLAKSRGVNTLCAFFGEETASFITSQHGLADLIFGANVICHLPDMRDLAKGIKLLLSPNGKFIFEEPYVGSMLEKVSFDQIYDEHVFIFGVSSVARIFSKFGLELVDAEEQITHGGSMRYTLQHPGIGSKSLSLQRLEMQETKNFLHQLKPYMEFADKCVSKKLALVTLLTKLKNEGKRVAGYAATSKSTTVLNYCGIGRDLIEFIVDSTPEKQGKYAPGSHIPIISDTDDRVKGIDYFLLFAWNHQAEIMAKEHATGNTNFGWIVFVPEVKILD